MNRDHSEHPSISSPNRTPCTDDTLQVRKRGNRKLTHCVNVCTTGGWRLAASGNSTGRRSRAGSSRTVRCCNGKTPLRRPAGLFSTRYADRSAARRLLVRQDTSIDAVSLPFVTIRPAPADCPAVGASHLRFVANPFCGVQHKIK